MLSHFAPMRLSPPSHPNFSPKRSHALAASLSRCCYLTSFLASPRRLASTSPSPSSASGCSRLLNPWLLHHQKLGLGKNPVCVASQTKMNTPKTTALCLLTPVVRSLLFVQTTTFYMPRRSYAANTYVEDPSGDLEQAPLTIPKGTETQALPLAHCEWKETLTTHIITLDAPGLSKDHVNIELENNVPRISGERKAEAGAKGEGEMWHRQERATGKFLRRLLMPWNADVEAIKAYLKNGVLKITTLKAAEGKMQRKVIGIEEEDYARSVRHFGLPGGTMPFRIAPCDWKETPTEQVLDVPRLNVDVKIQGQSILLTISGERKTEAERAVKVSLEFQMPKYSNVEALEHHLKKGVFTIKLPKEVVGMKQESNEMNNDDGGGAQMPMVGQKRKRPDEDDNGGGEPKKPSKQSPGDDVYG